MERLANDAQEIERYFIFRLMLNNQNIAIARFTIMDASLKCRAGIPLKSVGV